MGKWPLFILLSFKQIFVLVLFVTLLGFLLCGFHEKFPLLRLSSRKYFRTPLKMLWINCSFYEFFFCLLILLSIGNGLHFDV